MSSRPKRSHYYGWIPLHPEVYRAFIKEKVTKARKRKEGGVEPHTPPVAAFAAIVLGDSVIRNLFEQIFVQVNTDSQWVDPSYVVTDFETLFHLLDVIVNEPPAFYEAETADGTIIGEPIGVPMYLVFDLPSNTSAGYDLFRYSVYNAALKDLLDSWGAYLTTSASNTSLTSSPGGWFSPKSIAAFWPYVKPLTFDTTYVCPDPTADNKGFASWDAFFTRTFLPGVRPVESQGDPSFITNACESATLRYVTNVKLHDTFWLKDQEYSLYDILNKNDEDAQSFVGGTVYQAFLSPQDYHRWHSPVGGTITKAYVVPGTYYAALSDDGAPAGDPDLRQGDPHGALIRSQPWLTVAATRALIFIQSSNTDVGLVCFVGIGMAEVSTCEITVGVGDTVAAGDQLGMFHFGGSSHALLFGPQAQITFEDAGGNPIEENTHYWINTIIGKIAQT